jgi:hypothetical protein
MGQEQTAVRGESLQDNGLEGKLEPDQQVAKKSHSITHAVVTASGREILLRFSRHVGAIVLRLLSGQIFCPSPASAVTQRNIDCPARSTSSITMYLTRVLGLAFVLFLRFQSNTKNKRH